MATRATQAVKRARQRAVQIRTLGFSSLLLAGVSLLLAGAASATPVHFAEMLTASNPLDLFSNQRITAEADHRVGLFELAVMGSHQSGAGIGPSHVTGNQSLTYRHSFTPSASSASVIRASLAVMLIDDHFCDGPEWAEITIDGTFWSAGQATFNFLRGDVTAYITNVNDTFDVSVSSSPQGGGFYVAGSLLRVQYEADAVVAVPEPGALTLFCAGVLIVGVADRKRRRAS